jgi:hypothetical protein
VSEKKTVYDGLAYYDIELEPILINDKNSGHYKIKSKTKVSVYGLIDNVEEKTNFLKIIRQALRDWNEPFNFLVVSDNKKYIFTLNRYTSEAGPNSKINFSDAILDIITKVGYLQSYKATST